MALCKNSGLTPYIYLKAGILKREGSGSFGKAAGNMPPAFLFFFLHPLYVTEKDKSGLTPPSIAFSFNCRINPFFFMPVQKRKNRPCLLRLGRLVSFSCAAKLTFSGSLSRTTKVGKSRLYSVAFLPMCLIGYIWDYLALVDFVL